MKSPNQLCWGSVAIGVALFGCGSTSRHPTLPPPEFEPPVIEAWDAGNVPDAAAPVDATPSEDNSPSDATWSSESGSAPNLGGSPAVAPTIPDPMGQQAGVSGSHTGTPIAPSPQGGGASANQR